MKKSTLLITVFLLLVGSSTNAQKPLTEGKIIFEMTVPDSGKSIMGTQVVYFKDSSSRMEIKQADANAITITNAKTGESFLLTENEGKKVAIKMDKKDDAEAGAIAMDLMSMMKPKIKLVSGEKKVAGFNCKKALLTSVMDTVGSEVWYTNEIALPSATIDKTFSDLEGSVLEYTVSMSGLAVKTNCISVERIPVADSLFLVPKEYKVVTMAEWMTDGMK